MMMATCPLCHTVDATVSVDALESGVDWTCGTCGQNWSAGRLRTVVAYKRYCDERAAAAAGQTPQAATAVSLSAT
jgi:transcription elongation factor Elf1